MKLVTKALATAILLGTLAVVGVLMGPPQLAAQGQLGTTDGLAVRIVNPIPVPVTGALGVTQSGTWNVGITGTPTVLARNPEEPGRVPFQQEMQVPSYDGCFNNVCTAGYSFAAVPAGKRLVVQYVSASFVTRDGGTAYPITLSALGPGFQPQMQLPATRQATNVKWTFGVCVAADPCDSWVMNQQVNYYVEPGYIPSISIPVAQGDQVVVNKHVTVHGYYVSVP